MVPWRNNLRLSQIVHIVMDSQRSDAAVNPDEQGLEETGQPRVSPRIGSNAEDFQQLRSSVGKVFNSQSNGFGIMLETSAPPANVAFIARPQVQVVTKRTRLHAS